MKYPNIPTKPYAPYLPQPPRKQMEEKKTIGVLTSQEDNSFSVQWFVDYIKENFPDENPENVHFSMEINTTHGYYDQVSTSLDFTFYTVGIVDDPRYDNLYKHYEKQMETYKKDFAKYREDMKKYKIAEKQYQEDVEAYQLEQAKAIIAKHEKNKGKNK